MLYYSSLYLPALGILLVPWDPSGFDHALFAIFMLPKNYSPCPSFYVFIYLLVYLVEFEKSLLSRTIFFLKNIFEKQ